MSVIKRTQMKIKSNAAILLLAMSFILSDLAGAQPMKCGEDEISDFKMQIKMARSITDSTLRVKTRDSGTDLRFRRGDKEYDSAAAVPLETLGQSSALPNCTSVARLMARYLAAFGIKAQIAATVELSDLQKMCPKVNKSWLNSRQGPTKEASDRGIFASGHDVILIKSPCSDKWYYLNPRSPNKNLELTLLDRSLEELQRDINDHPVLLPDTVVHSQINRLRSSGEIIESSLVLFHIHGANFQHTFKDRLNMIASGNPNSSVCRYGFENLPMTSRKTLPPANSRTSSSMVSWTAGGTDETEFSAVAPAAR
jgi:hypothetical protein